jgi:hypothetical protein
MREVRLVEVHVIGSGRIVAIPADQWIRKRPTIVSASSGEKKYG